MQVAFFGGVNAVQRRTPGAVRCTAPSWTSEVQTPELAACQPAPVQARLAWARRLRRLTPLPWPFPRGLWERALARSVSRTTRQWRAARCLCNSLAEIIVAVCAQLTPSRAPDLAYVAEDCRRHALFMAKPSNEPSRTERRNHSRTMGSTWILRRFVPPLLGSSSTSAAAGAAGAAQRELVWAISSCVSGRTMAAPGRHQSGRCRRTARGSSWWWRMCS